LEQHLLDVGEIRAEAVAQITGREGRTRVL